MALSPEDVQAIVDAVEQLDWVEWVKNQMNSEPQPTVPQPDLAELEPPPQEGAPVSPFPAAPDGAAPPPVPGGAPVATPAPEAQIPAPFAPAEPPPEQEQEQMRRHNRKRRYGLIGGGGKVAGAAHGLAGKVLFQADHDDDDEVQIDVDMDEEDEELADEYNADDDDSVQIDIDLEDEDEDEEDEESEEYQARLYQALEEASVSADNLGEATKDSDVADPGLMKFSKLRSSLRSERTRYSRLANAHNKLKSRLDGIEIEKVAAQRYAKIQQLSFEYVLDLAKESERCSMMSSPQFEDHLDVIAENYSRIPLAERTPQLFTPDLSADTVQSDRYAKDTADAAVAHCMRERDKGNTITYVEALEAVRAG